MALTFAENLLLTYRSTWDVDTDIFKVTPDVSNERFKLTLDPYAKHRNFTNKKYAGIKLVGGIYSDSELSNQVASVSWYKPMQTLSDTTALDYWGASSAGHLSGTENFNIPYDRIFTEDNPTETYVNLYLSLSATARTSDANTYSKGTIKNGVTDKIIPSSGGYRIGRVEYAVPPEAKFATVESTGPYYGGLTAYKVRYGALAKCGGYIDSVKLSLSGYSEKVEPSAAYTEGSIGVVYPRVDSETTVFPRIYIRDSRGQTYEKSFAAISIKPYSFPIINDFEVLRCDENGIESDVGLYSLLKIKIQYKADSLKTNDVVVIKNDEDTPSNVRWYYNQNNNIGVYDEIAFPFEKPEGEYITIYGLCNSGTAVRDSTKFEATIFDIKNGASQSFVDFLAPAYFTMDVKAGGQGIAFGTLALEDGFFVDMPAKFGRATSFEDQAYTSFKSSVAMGSYGSAQTTIQDFVDEVRYSSGAAGSVEIDTAYTKDGVTIPAGWYSFMYMPHRTGGKNGQVDPDAIDNVDYGNLLLFGFASGSGRYDITVDSGAISKLVKLMSSEDIRKSPTTSTHTKNVGKIAANTYKDCVTDAFTPTTAQSGLTPVITGWNVSGTGTSNCQVMGSYLSGNATSGYVGHVKVKNDSASQIGDVTIEVRLLWA